MKLFSESARLPKKCTKHPKSTHLSVPLGGAGIYIYMRMRKSSTCVDRRINFTFYALCACAIEAVLANPLAVYVL